jgi:hypothetical protein
MCRGCDCSCLQASYLICSSPLSPLELHLVHVMLLWTNNTTWPDNAHKRNRLRCCKAILPDKICPNEASSTTEPRFALSTI